MLSARKYMSEVWIFPEKTNTRSRNAVGEDTKRQAVHPNGCTACRFARLPDAGNYSYASGSRTSRMPSSTACSILASSRGHVCRDAGPPPAPVNSGHTCAGSPCHWMLV